MTVSYIKDGSMWTAFVYSHSGSVAAVLRGRYKRKLTRYIKEHVA